MALDFPGLCPPRAGHRSPCGDHHLRNPSKTTLARGVFPLVLARFRFLQPNPTHHVAGCAVPHTDPPPSAPRACHTPIFRAPRIHTNGRTPQFSSDLGGSPAAPCSPCGLLLPTRGLCRAGSVTATISSRKSCNLLFLHIFFFHLFSRCRDFPACSASTSMTPGPSKCFPTTSPCFPLGGLPHGDFLAPSPKLGRAGPPPARQGVWGFPGP